MSLDPIYRLLHRAFEALDRPLREILGPRTSQLPALCPITWQPSVLAPVFYGVKDYAPPDAPGICRVFYPTLDGAVYDAPILRGCGRYPLIAMLHGHCDQDLDANGQHVHYKKWIELPASLARSGYVVVVPHLPNITSGHPPSGVMNDVALVTDILNWMRNGWEHDDELMPRPATGIVGHSYGALLGGSLAQSAQLEISAFVSLAGVWTEWQPPPYPIASLTIPMLFTWGSTQDYENLDLGGLWGTVHPPKHRAVFDGAGHWDYFPAGRTACEVSRGPCNGITMLTADLVATFFGKYLPPQRWSSLRNSIPDTLIIPTPLILTMEQTFFAGGHLMSLDMLPGTGCSVTLGWETTGPPDSTIRP